MSAAQPEPPGDPAHSGARRFFGYLLVTAGVLIAGLAGLCSVIVIGMSLNQLGDALQIVVPVAILPILVGLGLYAGGRALLRPRR